MKKIVLISTFCDTQEKQDILLENILKIKELGIDVMALGPNFIQLPPRITEACDYFFYTKDNPLLEWPVRAYTHWYRKEHSPEKILYMHRGLADYGWAALYQTKKLSQLALTFDYDIFYHMIYDLEINEVVKQELLSNKVNLIYPRRNPKNLDEVWETTLHFMVFDRPMMENIEKEITLEEYLRTNGVAEGEVYKWREKYNLKTSNHPVVDKIFYWENFTFYDYKIFPEFEMFISKNEPTDFKADGKILKPLTDNLRIVFHGFEDTIGEVKVKVNGTWYNRIPKPFEFEEFPVSSQNINELIFEYNGKQVDYTKDFSYIMRNLVYYDYRK
jgi:hypothetical protein